MRIEDVTPPVFQMTGTLTSSSAVVTGLAVYAGLPFAQLIYAPFVGMPVAGTGIPSGAVVASVQSATQVTLSANATAGGSPVLTFGSEPVLAADAVANAVIENPDDLALVNAYITAARMAAETSNRARLITRTRILYMDGFPSGGGYYNRDIRQLWAGMGGNSGLGFYPNMFPNSTGVIDIPEPPIQQVVSVQYINFANQVITIAPSVYNVSIGKTGGRIQPQYSTVWPIARPTIDSVFITFTCGYGPLPSNIPASIQLAIKFLIGHWYRTRENVVAGQMLVVPHTFELLMASEDPGIYA